MFNYNRSLFSRWFLFELKEARENCATFSTHSTILVIGGYDGSSMSSVEKKCEEDEEFEKLVPLRIPRQSPVVDLLYSTFTLVVLGGLTSDGTPIQSFEYAHFGSILDAPFFDWVSC